MQLYEVVLSSGVHLVYAQSKECAAWSALELAIERNSHLINVRLKDAW